MILDNRACDNQPCLNDGICVVYLGNYLCQCQRGYSGRSCEIGKFFVVNVFRSTRFCLGPIERLCNGKHCIHGDCTIDGKCLCHNGWTSETCNQTSSIRMFVKFILRTDQLFSFTFLFLNFQCTNIGKKNVRFQSESRSLTNESPSDYLF